MITVKATIRNEAGIHCRPSAAIVKAVAACPGQVTVTSSSGSCDLKSIMGLLALGLAPNEKIEISVSGEDERNWARKLKTLFEKRFDYPPRAPGQTTATLLAASDHQGETKR